MMLLKLYMIPTRLTIGEQMENSVGKDVEKLEFLCVAVRNVKQISHCRKQYGSPQKIKYKMTTRFSIPLLRICPKIESRDSNKVIWTPYS